MRHTFRRALAPLLAVLGAGALLAAVSTGSAQAAPTGCDYPVAVCDGPTLAVSTTVPNPGEVIGVTGAGFVADARVTLLLEPVNASEAAYRSPAAQGITLVAFVTAKAERTALATVGAGADGAFDTSVTIPESARGKYDVVAVNGTPAGFDDPSARITVAQGGGGNNHTPSNDETTTAFTGTNLLWLVLLAIALIAIGVYATRHGRRGETVRSIHG